MAWSIASVEESATAAVQLLEQELAGAGLSAPTRARTLFFLSGWHRAAGIGRLLTLADRTGFFASLTQSARCRVELLRMAAQSAQVPARFGTLSAVGPLLDAVAAAADGLAAEIVTFSTTPFLEYEELREDHDYARLLQWLVSRQGRLEEGAARLSSCMQTLDGDPPPRLLLCKAILDRDQRAFDRSVEDAIAERAAHFDRKARSLSVKDEAYETDRFLFVEGLALVRLAAAAGLTVQREYRFMPGLAMVR